MPQRVSRQEDVDLVKAKEDSDRWVKAAVHDGHPLRYKLFDATDFLLDEGDLGPLLAMTENTATWGARSHDFFGDVVKVTVECDAIGERVVHLLAHPFSTKDGCHVKIEQYLGQKPIDFSKFPNDYYGTGDNYVESL